MALSYQQQHAQQDAILIRLSQCLIETSIEVINEDPATPDHDQRANLARYFIANPENNMPIRNFARGVLTSDNAGTGGVNDPMVDDAALKIIVSSLWNSYAGVT